MSEQTITQTSEPEFVPEMPKELPLPEIEDEGLELAGEEEAPAQKEHKRKPSKPEVQPDGTRSQTILVDGREYQVNEEILKKYYNFVGDEPLTEREFKTLVSSYKQKINNDNKSREASTLIKQVEGVLGQLKNNTKDSLRKLFADNPAKLREEVESLLLEELENEMLDPKEKELREYKRREEEWKQAREQEELAKRQAEEEYLANEYSKQIEADIMNVLDTSNLPKTRDTVLRIADYLLKANDRKMNLQASQVVALVKEDIRKELDSVLNEATDEQLIEILGEERLKKIRQADLKRLKSQPKAPRILSEDDDYQPARQTNQGEDWQSAKDRVRAKIAKLK